MSTPQPGVFAQGTRAHFHVELDLRPGVGDDALRSAVAAWREPSAVAGDVNLVTGFGAAAWRRIAPDDAPPGLRDFDPVGDLRGRHAPSTQHDVWAWIHGPGEDAVLDAARHVCAVLDAVATPVREVTSFVYRDSRDLTGFIDGTENPPVHEAFAVAVIPGPGPGAGGSFAITQQWRHDLAAFDRLSLSEQEGVIGRTKADSVELDDDAKAPTAHIARVVVVGDTGAELEIYRRSTPYGTVSFNGLYFVAFSAEVARFDIMLARMFGTSGDGAHDRLTEFTTPLSESYYFVPSLESLAAIAD
jgi:putative iron-dependent peroxidase